ncbi:MAG: ATPase, T2SS/T4P/T4SS family, partial [bacterium]
REAALTALVRTELDRVLAVTGGTAVAAAAPAPAAGPDEWALVHQGRLTEADLLRIYAVASGLKPLDEEQHHKPEPFLEAAFDFLSHWNCLPLNWDQHSILLAVTAPYRLGELAWQWQLFFGRHASFVLGRRSWIERQLAELYEKNLEAAGSSLDPGDNNSEQALRDLAREAPIVRLVNDMFSRAAEMGASDIHVEPSEGDLAVRYRIDGVLQTVLTPPKSHYAAISSRLKLLAGMNIAERRLPQDGRIDLQIGRNAIDVRVSTVPSMHGESIVLRLLQKDVSIFDLANLGMDATLRGPFEETVQMPHGMVLVVGPTGSGKTTTLYCVMKLLNHESSKIITLEDPVEYQMPGLTQIQVKAQIGLTFASGLRSIVRQDPDIILVGEIRDRETAEIAIHAALTGHLVLSTLHTNDAPGAISRLLDMGVEGFLISSSLLGVLSQRLVRRLCPDCHGTGRAVAVAVAVAMAVAPGQQTPRWPCRVANAAAAPAPAAASAAGSASTNGCMSTTSYAAPSMTARMPPNWPASPAVTACAPCAKMARSRSAPASPPPPKWPVSANLTPWPKGP